MATGTTQGRPRLPIEEAYSSAPEGRLRGCDACHVTWFGTDERCWVCGGTGDGPVVVVSPTGSQSWSPRFCEATADDAETAALLRRVAFAP
jgi:hypothetical protein